jgi:hypothetical protein
MYNHGYEDAAWDRLIDMQREMENSRLWADRSRGLLTRMVLLAERAWVLGGLAMRRAPRRRRRPA